MPRHPHQQPSQWLRRVGGEIGNNIPWRWLRWQKTQFFSQASIYSDLACDEKTDPLRTTDREKKRRSRSPFLRFCSKIYFAMGSAWEGTNFGPSCLLFEPRLCGCWLFQAIHSIPTLPMCHYKYNEWLEKVETGIHPPKLSPHPGFWVAGDENFGAWPLHFIPR